MNAAQIESKPKSRKIDAIPSIEFKDIPEFAYACMMDDPNKIVLIQRGTEGYRECPGYTREGADRKNEILGVTPALREMMIAGSMFGWGVPGASKPGLYERAITLTAEHGPTTFPAR